MEYLTAIIHHLGLASLLFVVFAALDRKVNSAEKDFCWQLGIGLLFGAVVSASMLNPIELPDGSYVDLRAGPLVMVAVFASPLAAIVTGVFAFAIRLFVLGGPLAVSGGASVVLYLVFGLVCRCLFKRFGWRWTTLNAAIVGIASAVFALIAFFAFIPWDSVLGIVSTTWPAVLMINSSSIVLINYLIQLHNKRIDTIEGNRLARSKAEDALRAKQDFLNVMSHELRTPLNPIIGFAQLLKSEPISDEGRESLTMIENAAERQLKLIDSILRYVALEKGEIRGKQAVLQLADLCREVIAANQDEYHHIPIFFENCLSAGDDDPCRVIGDASVVRLILEGLIDNACKFTREGQVTVRLSDDDFENSGFRIEVNDTGVGIPEKFEDRLFEPFEVADSSQTRPYEGSGISLAITKRLIALVGGSIGFQRNPLGKGSLFWISIPFARA